MVTSLPVQSPDRPPEAYPEPLPGRSAMHEPGAHEPVQSTIHHEPERFTIAQAATLLGTSRDAIRQRIRRGTLRSEKADGKWYVYLTEEPENEQASMSDGLDNRPSDHPGTVPSTRPSTQPYEDLYRQLVDQLRGEVTFLREELRRKDQLLAGFAQRFPALESPTEPLPSTQPAQPSPSQGEQASSAAPTHRPWWKFWVT